MNGGAAFGLIGPRSTLFGQAILIHRFVRLLTDVTRTVVGVGSYAWETFFGGNPQDVLEQSVAKLSDLDARALDSVFGKGGASAVDQAISAAGSKALQRVLDSSTNALVRRFTNQPGVVETEIEHAVGADDGLGNFRFAWHQINGLANDEVFLCQRIFVTWVGFSQVGRQMGLAVGRPYGPFQHTGQAPNTGYYPPTGVDQAASNIHVNDYDTFRRRCKVVWTVDTQSGSNFVLDLEPNFIPLRSYMIIYGSDLNTADHITVNLFGKKVKWLLPLEAF